jgi:hypothetical protein
MKITKKAVIGAGRTGQGPIRRRADLRLHPRSLTRFNLPKFESGLCGEFTRVKCGLTVDTSPLAHLAERRSSGDWRPVACLISQLEVGPVFERAWGFNSPLAHKTGPRRSRGLRHFPEQHEAARTPR